jgi:hypothetical protein
MVVLWLTVQSLAARQIKLAVERGRVNVDSSANRSAVAS